MTWGRVWSSLHLEGVLADYATGVDGVGRRIVEEGVEVIPRSINVCPPCRSLMWPTELECCCRMASTTRRFPVECSQEAAEKLRADGTEVLVGLSEDGDHRFDTQANVNVNAKTAARDGVTVVESLKKAVRFLSAAPA